MTCLQVCRASVYEVRSGSEVENEEPDLDKDDNNKVITKHLINIYFI